MPTRPTKVFQGKMLTRITCRGCGTVSTRSQEYYDLSLPVPADDPATAARCSADAREEGLHREACSAQGPGAQAPGETAPEVGMRQIGSRAGLLTVQQLLQAVLQSEELTGAEQYACDKCPDKQDALRQVPPSLVPCIYVITCIICIHYIHTYIHKYMHTYINTYTHTHTHMHTYTHAYMHAYICRYVCIHRRLRTFIRMYIHTLETRVAGSEICASVGPSFPMSPLQAPISTLMRVCVRALCECVCVCARARVHACM